MFFLRFVVSNFETWLEHVQCAWTTFPNSFFSGPSSVKSQHQRACCAVIVVVRHSGPKMTTPKWFTVQHGVIFYPKTYQPVIWRVPKISVPQTIRFSVENKNCWMILGFSRLKKNPSESESRYPKSRWNSSDRSHEPKSSALENPRRVVFSCS